LAQERTTAINAAFGLLGAVQVSLIFTLAVLAVPLPRIGREYGLDRADLILLNSSYGLMFAGLLLFGGRLADRYGGRRTFTAGLLIFAVATLAEPLAPAYDVLLVARFAQGAGAAVIAPAAVTVLRALFPDRAAYGRAMATWGGLSVIGATAGNLLGGIISGLTSWRWSFAIPLVVAAIALLLSPRLLPNIARRDDRPAVDVIGAVLATAGISLASYGLVMTEARSWSSAQVIAPLVIGGALLAVFFVVELHSAEPLLPPRFLLDRRRAFGLTAIGLTAASTATTFVVLSLYLQQTRGWSSLEVSAAFVPFAIALLCSGRAAAPLIARFGEQRLTAAGLGLAALGLILLSSSAFNAGTPYEFGLLPGLVLLPIGAAAAFAGAAVLAVESVPERLTGLASGTMNTAMELGPTIGLAALLSVNNDATSLALAAGAVGAAAVALFRITRSGVSI